MQSEAEKTRRLRIKPVPGPQLSRNVSRRKAHTTLGSTSTARFLLACLPRARYLIRSRSEGFKKALSASSRKLCPKNLCHLRGVHRNDFRPTSVQFKGRINSDKARKRHQTRHLEFYTPQLLTEGFQLLAPGEDPTLRCLSEM